MQMASPAVEVNRLFTLFGFGIVALKYLAYGIMFISAISIFIALYNRLKERKYEFALLRISGAGRMQLFLLVLIESLLLCIVGFIFGSLAGRMALMLISAAADEAYKLTLDPLAIIWKNEGFLLVLTIFVGVIAALLPAVKAYRLNISKTLANA
jgi:putative ABC transport system permease protein